MNFEKSKIVTAAGLISILSLSAQAGGIHCDDDPKCVPCILGATCHNSAFILSNC